MVLGVTPDVRTLIEHWDGTSWTIIPSPNLGNAENFLYGVAARSANDAWAVGSYYDEAGSIRRSLTLHWDGQNWSVPSPGKRLQQLVSVVAVSSGKFWGAGSRGEHSKALIQRWNGTRWRNRQPPALPPGSILTSITALSKQNVWAVGDYVKRKGQSVRTKLLIVRRISCG